MNEWFNVHLCQDILHVITYVVFVIQWRISSKCLYFPKQIENRNMCDKPLHIVLMHECDLTYWSRVTHICVSKLTIIGSDNGLSPGRRQAIIWTNAGMLIETLGTNVSEILIKICTFSLKKMILNMSCEKRRPSCLGLNVLTGCILKKGRKV